MSRTLGDSRKLSQEIAASIAIAIAAGAYPAGSPLPSEADLAAEFAVSRGTIREAIRCLQVQGLVGTHQDSGDYLVQDRKVAGATAGDVDLLELLEARMLLESEGAALAATSISDSELHQLEALVELIGMENEGERRSEEADRRFHLMIVAATGNAMIARLVENLWNLRYRAPLCHERFRRARRGGLRPRKDEHRAVFDALKARDPQSARNAMRRHLEQVAEDLIVSAEVEAHERAEQEASVLRSALAGRRALWSAIESDPPCLRLLAPPGSAR